MRSLQMALRLLLATRAGVLRLRVAALQGTIDFLSRHECDVVEFVPAPWRGDPLAHSTPNTSIQKSPAGTPLHAHIDSIPCLPLHTFAVRHHHICLFINSSPSIHSTIYPYRRYDSYHANSTLRSTHAISMRPPIVRRCILPAKYYRAFHLGRVLGPPRSVSRHEELYLHTTSRVWTHLQSAGL